MDKLLIPRLLRAPILTSPLIQ